jgi:acetolactate synthase I/III small subunit
MKHTFIALLRDRPGALTRAVNIFRRRGLNIERLTVAATERAGVSRMTVVVETDDAERLLRQFEQLIDVLQLHDVAADDAANVDGPNANATTPFNWQADGASDDVAA